MQDPLFFVIEAQESHPANPALLLFTKIQDGLWEGHLYKMHLLSLSSHSVFYPLSFLQSSKTYFFQTVSLEVKEPTFGRGRSYFFVHLLLGRSSWNFFLILAVVESGLLLLVLLLLPLLLLLLLLPRLLLLLELLLLLDLVLLLLLLLLELLLLLL